MVTGDGVTVVIPSLPERSEWLGRAVRSVERQSVPPADIVIHVDNDHAGAYAARNAALAKVSTPWVAFLDDDDQFHRDHLETLIYGANRSDADLVGTYPVPDRPGAPFLLACCHKGLRCPPTLIQWGPDQLDHFDARKGRLCDHCGTKRGSFIMITNLVRMDLVDKVDGFSPAGALGDSFAGHRAEDYLFLLKLLDAGARFHHVVGRRTWTYHVR
jgi:hypothetical protein